MNIDLLLTRLGRDPRQSRENRALAEKAKEYLRRAKNVVITGKHGAAKGEIAKPAACCALATDFLGDPLDTKKVKLLSGATEKVFDATVATLRTALGVSTKVSLQRLCLMFGCVRLEPAVRRLLACYREGFVSQLHASQRGNADFSSPVFVAAAFYLIARKNQVKVDRAQLLDNYKVKASEFTRVVKSVSETCPQILGTPKAKPAKGKRKRKGGDDVDEGDTSGDGETGAEEYLRNEEYDRWREKVLLDSEAAHPSDDRLAGSKPASLKQAKLTSMF